MDLVLFQSQIDWEYGVNFPEFYSVVVDYCSFMNLIGSAKVLVRVLIVLASIVSIIGWLST
jgi:hypothetical protein